MDRTAEEKSPSPLKLKMVFIPHMTNLPIPAVRYADATRPLKVAYYETTASSVCFHNSGVLSVTSW